MVKVYGEVCSSKYADVRFEPGDRVMLWIPGGGGYGDPAKRDPDRIAEEVRRGLRDAGGGPALYGWNRSGD